LSEPVVGIWHGVGIGIVSIEGRRVEEGRDEVEGKHGPRPWTTAVVHHDGARSRSFRSAILNWTV
jgi:hypothetical protein